MDATRGDERAMTQRAVEWGLWCGAVTGILAGGWGLRPSTEPRIAQSATTLPVLVVDLLPEDSLLTAVDHIRDEDVFRTAREPADGAGAPLIGAVMSQPQIKPPLVLKGLVGGTTVQAIIEGIPGVDGAAVMRAGEAVMGIRLRAVRGDTAILVSKDTTWKLTVRRLWQ